MTNGAVVTLILGMFVIAASALDDSSALGTVPLFVFLAGMASRMAPGRSDTEPQRSLVCPGPLDFLLFSTKLTSVAIKTGSQVLFRIGQAAATGPKLARIDHRTCRKRTATAGSRV